MTYVTETYMNKEREWAGRGGRNGTCYRYLTMSVSY